MRIVLRGCWESMVAVVKFDTRDKKPKIWNVAVISAAAVIAVAVLASIGGRRHITAISHILAAYYACVIIMLIRAFFRQLQYNPYSYNVIYYLGFSLFVFFVLLFHVISMLRVLPDLESLSIGQILSMLSGASRRFLLLISAFIIPFSAALAVSNISLIKMKA